MEYGSHHKEMSQGYQLTTNNRMEMMATIVALKALRSCEIVLSTDSQYVKQGIEQWMAKWRKRLENSRKEAGQKPGSLGSVRRASSNHKNKMAMGKGSFRAPSKRTL